MLEAFSGEDVATGSAAPAVDAVFLFADGSKPQFQRDHLRVVGEAPIPCQTRSLGELPYLLRSIQRCTPNLRALYMVVSDEEQVPDWLNRNEVTVVTHAQFMPEKILPNFNPHAIFAHLYLINGLGPRYVVWCDDIFFMPGDGGPAMFDSAGQPVLTPFIYTPVGPFDRRATGFLKRLQWNRRLLARVSPASWRLKLRNRFAHMIASHIPHAIDKSCWVEFMQVFANDEVFQSTIHSQRRDHENPHEPEMAVLELWFAWMLLCKRRYSVLKIWAHWLANQLRRWLPGRRLLGRPWGGQYGIRHDPVRTRAAMRALLRQSPYFFCLNDEAYDAYYADGKKYDGSSPQVYSESLKTVHDRLVELYPEPSVFERA